MRLRSVLLAATAATLILPAAVLAAPVMPAAPQAESLVTRVAYSPVVYSIQQELSAKGYNPGPIDGAYGSRTGAAIQAYQRDQGLAVTGQPSQSLLDHLRGSAAAQPVPQTPLADAQSIIRLQRDLERLGYNVEVNGLLDTRTREAIRAFERDKGYRVTGEASEYVMDSARTAVRTERREERENVLASDSVARIQLGLQARGYPVGNTNGTLDAETRNAIRAYQRDRGLTVTGDATSELATLLSEGLPATVSSRETIRAVQQSLNQKGYNAGPADGYMGPATREAIRQYSIRSGLTASTEVNQALLDSLGIRIAGGVAQTPATPSDTRGQLVFRDDFSDGNYTANPRWEVLGKSFTVENGALKSSVTLSPQTAEDRQRALIGGLLQQVFGVQLAGETNTAGIATGVDFDNEYAVSFNLRETSTRPARMNLGGYTGNNATHGYRLLYDSQAAQPLAVIAGSPSGFTTVASTAAGPKLDDGNWHRVTMLRGANGRLTVNIDNQNVLSVSDNSLTADHDGVSFVNASGDWEIDSVELMTGNLRQAGWSRQRGAQLRND